MGVPANDGIRGPGDEVPGIDEVVLKDTFAKA